MFSEEAVALIENHAVLEGGGEEILSPRDLSALKLIASQVGFVVRGSVKGIRDAVHLTYSAVMKDRWDAADEHTRNTLRALCAMEAKYKLLIVLTRGDA
jgi:hypothetical protein